MHYRQSERHRQGGVALVAALLIFALCASLTVAIKGEFLRFYERAANIFVAEQGLAYLRGAEELARRALLVDKDMDGDRGQARDDLTEVWAQTPVPYELDEGGWLMGSLTDLQGRFNLHTLIGAAGALSTGESQQENNSSAREQFIRLLQALEDVPVRRQRAIQIADAVIDWMDRDGRPRLNGAEDDYYADLEPAYRSANRPMESVSELMAVAHMTPEIYNAVLPFVTVLPQSADTLNIHTAPLTVLRTVNSKGNLNPLSLEEAQSLVESRERDGFADLDDFLAHPVLAPKNEQLQDLKAHLGETSSYFLLQAETEVADRRMRLYSVLNREGREVNAVIRAAGSL